MKWGIVVKWDDRGLACCEWMQLTDENTVDDPMEFANAADARAYISTLLITVNCIHTPTEFATTFDNHCLWQGEGTSCILTAGHDGGCDQQPNKRCRDRCADEI